MGVIEKLFKWLGFDSVPCENESCEEVKNPFLDILKDIEDLKRRVKALEFGPELKFGDKVVFKHERYGKVHGVFLGRFKDSLFNIVWWNHIEECAQVASVEEDNIERDKED